MRIVDTPVGPVSVRAVDEVTVAGRRAVQLGVARVGPAVLVAALKAGCRSTEELAETGQPVDETAWERLSDALSWALLARWDRGPLPCDPTAVGRLDGPVRDALAVAVEAEAATLIHTELGAS